MSSLTLSSCLFVLLASLSTFLYILHAAYLTVKHKKYGGKLPPGPRALPIIGNLHLLGELPHQSLYQLAKRYGSIMSLRLGKVPTIVVSSSEAAELFLKTHDAVFASRPKLQAVDYLMYNRKGIIFAEYGQNWRSARKLITTELLTPSKIESFAPTRKAELEDLVETLRRAATVGEVVDLSNKVGELGVNMVYKMIFGRTKDERLDLKQIVTEGTILSGQFNIADYVPWLGALDLQGLLPQFKSISQRIDTILETLIDERKQDPEQKLQPDFLDILLLRMNHSMMSRSDDDSPEFVIDQTKMKALIVDVFAAASETTTTTIEWALAELQRHPHVKQNLQKELEAVVGMNRMVEETDLEKLSYLDMVIKETFRLHPPVPLLLPHESIENVTINGYDIPKKSRILVNAWAIGRDPSVWSENAEEFIPERFSQSNVDFRGHNFQLIPFGSGRRGCPGIQLGILTVKYVLSQLMHCFDWELPGMLPFELDMAEKFGTTLPRKKHLFAKPTYRLVKQ